MFKFTCWRSVNNQDTNVYKSRIKLEIPQCVQFTKLFKVTLLDGCYTHVGHTIETGH